MTRFEIGSKMSIFLWIALILVLLIRLIDKFVFNDYLYNLNNKTEIVTDTIQ